MTGQKNSINSEDHDEYTDICQSLSPSAPEWRRPRADTCWMASLNCGPISSLIRFYKDKRI